MTVSSTMGDQDKIRLSTDDINVIIRALKYNQRKLIDTLENGITYDPVHTERMERKVAQISVTREKLQRFKSTHFPKET